MSHTHRITELLKAWSAGDSEAFEKLIPLVDHELKQIARACMRNERTGHILQTTALVNEAFLKLFQEEKIDWHSRYQFYAIVAKRMRQVLVDYARKQSAIRRGQGFQRVDLEEVFLTSEQSEELIMLHEALEKLDKIDELKAKVVEYRYFGGFSFEEVADMLDLSKSTVEREWGLARAWLKREMGVTTGD